MSTQTILFIGSTGGCTNACLTHALLAGHRCIALVRNPDKLITKLKTDQGLSAGLISRQLTTVTGNAKSISDLKSALLTSTPITIPSEQSPPLPPRVLPDTIVSGLGAVGQLTWEFCKPLQIVKPNDPSLCTDGAKALMQALREIYAERPELVTEGRQKPKLVFVSTTGVTRGKEDVPAAMRFMYHQMLAAPHEDKKAMEDVFRSDSEVKDESQRVFLSVSCVRPTLLSGTGNIKEGKGLEKIRAGTEARPELGYGITRGEVGEWMFENLVQEGKGRMRWEGEMCSLTT